MYSADNSEVIEQAYKSHQKTVKLGSTHIVDLEGYLQINVNDQNKVRPIRRELIQQTHQPSITVANNGGILRKYRFFYPPQFTKSIAEVTEKGSSFIRACGNIEGPLMLVEKACQGIIWEGQNLPDQEGVAEQLADRLQHANPMDLPRLCIQLYTEQTFLYPHMNKALRENDRSKVSTYGAFALMLYKSLVQSQYKVYNATVYRGADLTGDMIQEYISSKGQIAKWLGFSSTTRNREKAFLGNTLFIIDIKQPVLIDCGFDISAISAFEDEEEVLLLAGGRFKIDRVEYEENKNIIYLIVF